MLVQVLKVKGGENYLGIRLGFKNNKQFNNFKNYIEEKYGNNTKYSTYEEGNQYIQNIWSEYKQKFNYIE